MSSQNSNEVTVESSHEYQRPFLPPKHRYMSNYFNTLHIDAESSTANGSIGIHENSYTESPTLSNGDITNAGGIILPVNPTDDDIFTESQADPFLLVSLSQRPPPRPKFEFLLYLFGVLDLAIVFICSYFLIYNTETGSLDWYRAKWDMIILAIFRFVVVLKVTSSTWINKSRYILGGACCISSLYIIFKANFIVQHKRPIQGYDLILIASSFFFLQIHWIANVIITTDTRHRDLFLRTNSIVFEEESSNLNDELPREHVDFSRNDTPPLPYYGATDNYQSTSIDKGVRI
ncbi:tetratricopeptide repeat domain 39b [Gigaspora margarita]|uniref:Tetratricopeptide repeat domain 39b n=1 Tax=Gigaspora margarita TaxID=4874 RepID=A0A8H4AQI9_GIGMA|nr:tetratricopeptide repeat domain 39b [Gigaspora margarita]